MYTPEKDARLSHLHQENRKAKLRIIRLEQKISLAANEDGVKLDDELHSDIMNLAASSTKQVHSSHSEDSFYDYFGTSNKKQVY